MAQGHKNDNISSCEQDTKLKFVQLFCNSIAEIPTKFKKKYRVVVELGIGRADFGEFLFNPEKYFFDNKYFLQLLRGIMLTRSTIVIHGC